MKRSQRFMSELHIEPAVIVGEQVAGRSAKVRQELEALNTLVLDSTFEIADLLSEVKAGHYYGDWGYETFAAYVETVLGMKERKAQYLVRIVTLAKQLDIPRTAYQDTHITKLREIFTLTPFDTEGKPLHSTTTGKPIAEHIKQLVATASHMKVSEIVSEVAHIKGEVGEEEMVFLSIKVSKSCRDNVILPARELARQRLGSMPKDGDGDSKEYSDSACEEVIHADFLSDPNNAEQPTTEEIIDELAQAEQADGLYDLVPDELVIEPDDDTSEPLGDIKI